MTLRIVPVDLRDARLFVALHHRHNDPPIGHKFSVGVAEGNVLVGVAIVGRPLSRVLQAEKATLEVIRTATDGTHNANSMLYGAARRVAFALGYDRLITYTQDDETGASLRAAGFRVVAQRPARPGWDTPSRRRTDKADNTPRDPMGHSMSNSKVDATYGAPCLAEWEHPRRTFHGCILRGPHQEHICGCGATVPVDPSDGRGIVPPFIDPRGRQ